MLIVSVSKVADDIVGTGPIEAVTAILRVVINIAQGSHLDLSFGQAESPNCDVQERVVSQKLLYPDRSVLDDINVGAALCRPSRGSDRVMRVRDKHIFAHTAVHIHAAVDEPRWEKSWNSGCRHDVVDDLVSRFDDRKIASKRGKVELGERSRVEVHRAHPGRPMLGRRRFQVHNGGIVERIVKLPLQTLGILKGIPPRKRNYASVRKKIIAADASKRSLQLWIGA